VRVGAAGNDAVTFRGDGGGKNFGVGYDLACIVAERRLLGFEEADSFGSNEWYEGATLHAREERLCRWRDRGQSWPESSLHAGRAESVGSGGNDLRMRTGEGCAPPATKPGKVRHIDEKDSAHFVGDGPHSREIDGARICAAAAG